MPIVVRYNLNIESLRYVNRSEDDNLEDTISRFSKLIESLHENEKIFFGSEIWEMEIEDGKYLYDLDMSNDHGALLFKTFRKPSNFPAAISYIYNLDFYKTVNNYIYDKTTKQKALRSVISSLTDVDKYIELMPIVFDNLLFSTIVPSIMKHHYRPFHDFYIHITKHLETLNEYALEIYNEHQPNEEHKMCSKLGTKGSFGCSLESGRPNPDAHTFSFNGVKAECYPHTKLIHDGTDHRIYFKWNDSQIQNGTKTLVGHIGGHIR